MSDIVIADASVPMGNESEIVVHSEFNERADNEVINELSDDIPAPQEYKDNLTNEEDEKKAAEERRHARSLAQPGRYIIEDMQKIAFERGGKCLSTDYKNIGENLTWECHNGHIWEAVARNVKHHDSWCPKCNGNVGEEIVRATLIEAFPGKIFERTRREEWLGGLELDGYNAEMKLAFEYQGKQHFERVLHFQREEGQFESQLARDVLKRERCKNAGIVLLEISYKIKYEELRVTVRKMLTDLKFTISDAIMTYTEFYNTIRAGSYDNTQLELAKRIAIEKGGVCLSNRCISYEFKMPFRCGQGHEFNASLQDINQPRSRGVRFCPECGGTKKKSDDEVRARVEAIGYRFINIFSKKGKTRSRRYLTIQCPANHDPYEVSMENMISGDGSLKKGCKKCQSAVRGKELRFDIESWSKETGIEAVGEYTRRDKICTWKCSRGHVFDATLVSLKSRLVPCRICSHGDP